MDQENTSCKTLSKDKISSVRSTRYTHTLHTETWKPIPEWPYEVSDLGRVRRSDATKRIIKGGTCGRKTLRYPTVLLSKNKIVGTFIRHRLVAEAFLGPCPEGMEVNHIDRDTFNAAVSNLEYVTPTQNRLHSADTVPRGSKHYSAKLTENDAQTIRELYDDGWTKAELARRYSVKHSTIHFLITRHTWKHVA